MLALSSDNLSKTYRKGFFRRPDVTALREVSLAVEPGEIFSLLGPNGAGKTTFMKIILSLTHATSGEVTMLGVKLPNVAVRRRVGYLPENHRYPAYMTGEQVLTFFGRLGGVAHNTLRANVPRLLEQVGLIQWAGVKVRKYSKGMMQRLGLAQALVNAPDILFLDEPTDGVDPVGRTEIREILREQKRLGKTVFLNSHLLSEVELVSDRAAILDHGKLLTVGTIEQLTGSGTRYEIGIAGELPEGFKVEAAAVLLRYETENNRIISDCPTPAALNRLIDLLRKHGVEITSLARQRNTLEESFISLLKKEAQE